MAEMNQMQCGRYKEFGHGIVPSNLGPVRPNGMEKDCEKID